MAGMTHDEFWDACPGEVFDRVEILAESTKQKRHVNTTQAWVTARLMRGKDMIPLTRLLHGEQANRVLKGKELEQARRDHERLLEAAERAKRNNGRKYKTRKD